MDARVGALLRSRASRALRGVAHVAASHPWLARMAMRAFGAFPTLKLRVRRLILQPDESAATGALNDAQLRVLLDLRDATHQRQADGR